MHIRLLRRHHQITPTVFALAARTELKISSAGDSTRIVEVVPRFPEKMVVQIGYFGKHGIRWGNWVVGDVWCLPDTNRWVATLGNKTELIHGDGKTVIAQPGSHLDVFGDQQFRFAGAESTEGGVTFYPNLFIHIHVCNICCPCQKSRS